VFALCSDQWDFSLTDPLLADKVIYIGCEDFKCFRTVGFTAKDLQGLLGIQATFADLERRMKCAQCGKFIAGLRIVYHVGCS